MAPLVDLNNQYHRLLIKIVRGNTETAVKRKEQRRSANDITNYQLGCLLESFKP